jgi:hypothetical protein
MVKLPGELIHIAEREAQESEIRLYVPCAQFPDEVPQQLHHLRERLVLSCYCGYCSASVIARAFEIHELPLTLHPEYDFVSSSARTR